MFVDMRESELEAVSERMDRRGAAMLANCRSLVRLSRRHGWPLGFVVSNDANPKRRSRSRWIEGFEPERSDMVFRRSGASCYANPEFAPAVDAAGGSFLLAGFCGESAGLSTLCDARKRNHGVVYVCDASASRSVAGLDPNASHRVMVALASQFAAVITTARLLEFAQQLSMP